jgi:hypothetical protein
VAGFVYLAVPGGNLRIASGGYLADSERVQRTAWGDVTLNGQNDGRKTKITGGVENYYAGVDRRHQWTRLLWEEKPCA